MSKFNVNKNQQYINFNLGVSLRVGLSVPAFFVPIKSGQKRAPLHSLTQEIVFQLQKFRFKENPFNSFNPRAKKIRKSVKSEFR